MGFSDIRDRPLAPKKDNIMRRAQSEMKMQGMSYSTIAKKLPGSEREP